MRVRADSQKQKDIGWANAKVMLGASDFLKSLQEYDKDAITDKQVKEIKKYTSDKNFNPEFVTGVSKAGGGLLKWVFAMLNYNAVARTVNPKRAAVAQAEKTLRASEKELAKTKRRSSRSTNSSRSSRRSSRRPPLSRNV